MSFREVHAVLDKMAGFTDRLRSGNVKGYTGKRIRDVVNIGIGGSDLGPVMAYEALKFYSDRTMKFRFVSNVAGADFLEAVRDLDADETLFIVSSKTFMTLETMTNARTARAGFLTGLVIRTLSHGISSQSPRMQSKLSSSASIPRTCSASGIG